MWTTLFLQARKASTTTRKNQPWRRNHPGILKSSVADPKCFFLDPVPDPTFKEVSALTPDPDPVSDPELCSRTIGQMATLVSASRELRGKFALYS